MAAAKSFSGGRLRSAASIGSRESSSSLEVGKGNAGVLPRLLLLSNDRTKDAEDTGPGN